jgi:hypothetical protein
MVVNLVFAFAIGFSIAMIIVPWYVTSDSRVSQGMLQTWKMTKAGYCQCSDDVATQSKHKGSDGMQYLTDIAPRWVPEVALCRIAARI